MLASAFTALKAAKLWIGLGVVAALVIGAAGMSYRLTRDHYEVKLAAERQARTEAVARANQKAVEDMERLAAAYDAQIVQMQKAQAQRQQRGDQIRKEIVRAKNGNACADSAPVRALLDGMRRGQQGTSGAVPGGAAQGAAGTPRVRP